MACLHMIKMEQAIVCAMLNRRTYKIINASSLQLPSLSADLRREVRGDIVAAPISSKRHQNLSDFSIVICQLFEFIL
jgi:hypothetical protein